MSADLLSALLPLISAIRHTWQAALCCVLVPPGGKKCQVIGQRNFYPGASPKFIQETGCFIWLKGLGVGLSENRTSRSISRSTQNENFQRMKEGICIEALKVTAKEAYSPLRPRAKQRAGQKDCYKDNRCGNIARCRSKDGRDARRPRIIGINRLIVPKLFFFFLIRFEVKYITSLKRGLIYVLFAVSTYFCLGINHSLLSLFTYLTLFDCECHYNIRG